MSRRTPAKRKGGPAVGLLLLAAVLLAAVLYLTGGAATYHGTKGAEEEIAQSRARLATLEQLPLMDPDAEIHQQRREELAARGGIVVEDLAAEQQKILAMTEWSKSDLARWFQDVALMGDSVTAATRKYGWLEAPVFAKGGVHLSADMDQIDAVITAAPSVIVMCFGMNDAGIFKSDVGHYVSRYSACIRRLQEKLPDAVIYVHGALPPADRAIKKRSVLKYISEYNAAMRQACPELGVYYIDADFLLLSRPDLYGPDGIHPRRNFYPMWLTYLSDIRGLNR